MNRRRGLARLFERHGRPICAVLMALLTVFATAGAALQSDASTQSARSERDADAIALQRSGISASQIVGGIRNDLVYRHWVEESERLAWDERTDTGATTDKKLLDTLTSIDSSLADWLRQQSPMLQPPYYDPATGHIEIVRYVIEREADSIRAGEQYAAANDVADGWKSKAKAYVTVLALLSVALFFLGLASSLGRRVGLFLAGAGVALGAVSIAWTAAVAFAPVHHANADAIEHVVASQIATYQTPSAEVVALTDEDRSNWQKAVDEAAAAVDLDPGYQGAHRALAMANLGYGGTLLLSDDESADQASSMLRVSVRELERCVDQEPTSSALWWNLGWARYLLGDANGSITATNKAKDLAPNEFALYFNRAYAEIALGRTDEATETIQEGLAKAADVRLDSTTFYFQETDLELGRLAQIRPDQADGLLAMQRTLREARVARAVGRDEPDAKAPKIDSLKIFELRQGADGGTTVGPQIVQHATVSDNAYGLNVQVAASAIQAGKRHVSVRVWRDGSVDSDYDADLSWPDGGTAKVDLIDPFGRAGYPMQSGTYHVEVYVDGATRGSVDFTIGS